MSGSLLTHNPISATMFSSSGAVGAEDSNYLVPLNLRVEGYFRKWL
jgi:hypothetical protein